MSLRIGRTILHLRKKCNITQEQLAINIGVSAQAVSKWETDMSYPDIGLFPVIAEFFGVSIDYLLGFNVSEKRSNIDESLLEIKQLNYDGKYQEAIKLIEEIQTYPINYGVEFERGQAKGGLAKKEENDKDRIVFLCEARSIFEMIIQNCMNCKLIDESKRALAVVFNALGEYDKAIEILNSINAHFDTSGVISRSYREKGDTNSSIRILQEHLLRSINGVYKACFALCSVHNKMKDYDKALRYIELSSMFLEIANKKGETNFWNDVISTNFFYAISSLIKADKVAEATKVLGDYVDHVINLDKQNRDKLNDVWYFYLLTPSTLKDNASRCEMLLNNLKSAGMYNKLREQAVFNELVTKLETELIKLHVKY